MSTACRASVGFRRLEVGSTEQAAAAKCWALAQMLHSDDTSCGTLETCCCYRINDSAATPYSALNTSLRWPSSAICQCAGQRQKFIQVRRPQ